MNAKIIEALNQARSRELTAIMTYMAQHYELEDQDMGKLGDKMKEIGIQEMKHAEALAERILWLGGEPVTKPDSDIKRGLELAKMLELDIKLESGACAMYNASIKLCAAEGDDVTKKVFEQLLAEEEAHLDFFQNVQDHVEKMGAAYLATLVE